MSEEQNNQTNKPNEKSKNRSTILKYRTNKETILYKLVWEDPNFNGVTYLEYVAKMLERHSEEDKLDGLTCIYRTIEELQNNQNNNNLDNSNEEQGTTIPNENGGATNPSIDIPHESEPNSSNYFLDDHAQEGDDNNDRNQET
jgi:hypothetical protein